MSILLNIVNHVIAHVEEKAAEIKARFAEAKEEVHDVAVAVKDDVIAAIDHIAEVKQQVEQAGEKIAEAVIPHLAPLVSFDLDERIAEHLAKTGEQLDKYSVTDVFKAYDFAGTFEERSQWANDFGMTDYRGTAEQNDELRQRFEQWMWRAERGRV